MRGFAAVIFENLDFLVDWDLHEISEGIKGIKERFDTLLLRYLPDLVVFDDYANTRQGKRAKKIIKALERRARDNDIETTLVSREEARKYFAKAGFTKQAIAEEIVRRFPELGSQLPKKRRAWDSEKERMSIFDAASFALTALARKRPSDIEF